MPYAYELLIKEKELNIADLPEEVQVAIDELKQIDKGLNLIKKKAEKNGEDFKISDRIEKKKKAMDKFAVSGINDYLIDKEVEGEAPHTAEEVLDEAKEGLEAKAPVAEKTKEKKGKKATDDKPSSNKELGLAIDAELASILASGKSSITFDELKYLAPKSYNHIFETYTDGEANGIETSHYKIIETETEIFNVTKK
jgi:hypothetical protein